MEVSYKNDVEIRTRHSCDVSTPGKDVEVVAVADRDCEDPRLVGSDRNSSLGDTKR